MAVNVAVSAGAQVDPAGTAASLVTAHVAANEPHGSRTTLPTSPNSPQAANYTIQLSDRGYLLEGTNASTGQTFTVPSGIFSTGDIVYIRQQGTGTIAIAGSGVTIDGTAINTAQQYAMVALHFRSATEVVLSGALV